MKKISILIFLFLLFVIFNPRITFGSNNQYRSYQTYLNKINYYGNIESSFDGDGVVVAIIDSGVWLEHPDLVGTNWVNKDEIPNNNIDDDKNGYIDDYYGWNFIDNNHNLITKNSHGTAVAGIIAAQHNNIGLVGIAPKSKIMPLIVCDNGCYSDDIYDAIIYAVDNGADIINLSLGGSGYVGYDMMYNSAIEYAYNNNVVIVAAAGNGDVESNGSSGQNLDFLKVSPVCNEPDGINMVIGVGATTNWSNYGSQVDVKAPGENLLLLGVPVYNYEYVANQSGTSFSAPMIAGTAALIKSSNPNLKNWEIIDKLTYFDELNINNILRGHEKRCEINSLDKRSINNDEVITFSGQHVNSKTNFILYNSSIQIPINNYINYISANKFSLDISNLNLLSGEYSLGVQGTNPCDIDNNVKFVLNDNNSESIEPLEEINPIIVKKVDETINFVSDEKEKIKNIDTELSNKLKGKILLQVESHGEAWYVHPKTTKRHYMANGNEAYNIMRDLGVGITNVNLNRIKQDNNFAKKFSGTIFLQVEDLGQAFYIDFDGQAHYLKDGQAAYNIMREFGLGIKNQDIEKIDIE